MSTPNTQIRGFHAHMIDGFSPVYLWMLKYIPWKYLFYRWSRQVFLLSENLLQLDLSAEILLPDRKSGVLNEKHSVKVFLRSWWKIYRCMLTWMCHDLSRKGLHGVWLLSQRKKIKPQLGILCRVIDKQHNFHYEQNYHTVSSVVFFQVGLLEST